MGADQIGFLVKGPRKITKTAWKQASKTLLARLEPMWTTHKLECPECGFIIDTTDPDACECGCEHCGSDGPRFLMALENRGDFDTFMKEMEAWPPGGRDVSMRQDPDDAKTVLVFAGEMTWGDSPSGYGYGYIHKLMSTGLGASVGVR